MALYVQRVIRSGSPYSRWEPLMQWLREHDLELSDVVSLTVMNKNIVRAELVHKINGQIHVEGSAGCSKSYREGYVCTYFREIVAKRPVPWHPQDPDAPRC